MCEDPQVFGLEISRHPCLAGEKGRWFGSNDKLAEACGCSLLTLRKAIRGLEQEKLIRVERQAVRSRYRPGGGWNQYFFLGHRLFQDYGKPLDPQIIVTK